MLVFQVNIGAPVQATAGDYLGWTSGNGGAGVLIITENLAPF
jgi:hypothetical protein